MFPVLFIFEGLCILALPDNFALTIFSGIVIIVNHKPELETGSGFFCLKILKYKEK